MQDSDLQGRLLVNGRASGTEAKDGLHENKSLHARGVERLVLYP